MGSSQSAPAILFDLDGTLVDSDALHFRSFQTALFDALPALNDGVPITREFFDASISGKENTKIMADLAPELSEEARVAITEEKDRLYLQYISHDVGTGIVPINGLLSLLDAIDTSKISKAIVTNSPRAAAFDTLDALKLTDRFGKNVVIGEECAKPKPAPEPYLEGLKVVGGTAKRTVVLEDSPSGIASAKAAGLFTIGILSSREEAELLKAGADVCIEDYSDPKLWCIIRKQLQLKE